MKSLLALLSHILAQTIARLNILVLDFIMGATISAYAHYATDRPTDLVFICAGGLIAIVPNLIDLPVLPVSFWIYRREIDPHRMIQHWPLVMIPAVGCVAWYLTNDRFWLSLTCIVLSARFAHHMIGRTSGIRLFAPISMKFFGTNGIEDPRHSRRERYRRSHNRRQLINTNWMRPSLPCLIELALSFVFAVAAMIRTPNGVPLFMLWIASIAGLCFCTHVTARQNRYSVW